MIALISGGQTGVDRAALDVARELDIPAGGWCPRGRWAEDGRLAAVYPLREAISEDPAQRTVWNTFDADATLVVSRSAPSGGTRLALESAQRFDRPVRVIEPTATGAEAGREWLMTLPTDIVLNVAGPRESEEPGGYASAVTVLRSVLADRTRQIEPPRRVLVTGGAGCLGSRLIALVPPGIEVHATERSNPVRGCTSHRVDLADREAVRKLFDVLEPRIVVHTAYATHDMERDIVAATKNVVEAAAELQSRFVHVSTDMVLDGENAPFTEDAEPAPVHEYGRAKAEAERRVLQAMPAAAVIRNSLMTDFDPPDPRTGRVLEGLRTGSGCDLFVDEIRTPILVGDLARQVWEIVRLRPDVTPGIWNLAGPESMSRYTLGSLIAAIYGLDPRPLRAARSASYPGPRPRDLRLLTSRADRELPTRARALSEAAEI